MSYLFEMGDQEVWSPGNRIAELYVGMIETAAGVLDRPTGLTPKPGGSWYDVDRTAYPELVTVMVREFVASGNWHFRIMIGSLLGVSIGILDRAGIPIETRDEAEQKAVEELRDATF